VSQVSVDKALTPFAAYCYGAAFAQMVQIRSGKGSALSYIARNVDEWGDEGSLKQSQTVISVGRDPRNSGVRLADAFCRGLESVDGVTSQYTGIASTPAMFEFCRSNKCDGSVMITASHLPEDRNGMKFFTKNGGLTKADIEILADGATKCAYQWHDIGIVPPSSGKEAVFCSSLVRQCNLLHLLKETNNITKHSTRTHINFISTGQLHAVL
jgi:phosphomannomutase